MPSLAWNWAGLKLNTCQRLFSLSLLASTVCFTLYLYQHNKSSVYGTCYLQLWFVGIVGWFWLAQKSLISHQKHDTVSIWGKSQTCSKAYFLSKANGVVRATFTLYVKKNKGPEPILSTLVNIDMAKFWYMTMWKQFTIARESSNFKY